jgi:hypothetical protein
MGDVIPATALTDLSNFVIPSRRISNQQWDVRLRLGYYNEELAGQLWVWGAVLLLRTINRHTKPFVPIAIRESMKSTGFSQISSYHYPNNIWIFPSALPDMNSEPLAEAVRELWDSDHLCYVQEELRKWYRDGF